LLPDRLGTPPYKNVNLLAVEDIGAMWLC